MSDIETKATETKATETKEIGVGTYKFKNPTEINGEKVTEINYDLENMTGEDVAIAVRELAKHNTVVTFAETDQNYHAALFAQAAGIAFEDVKRFKLKDYNKVTSLVRDFFLNEQAYI